MNSLETLRKFAKPKIKRTFKTTDGTDIELVFCRLQWSDFKRVLEMQSVLPKDDSKEISPEALEKLMSFFKGWILKSWGDYITTGSNESEQKDKSEEFDALLSDFVLSNMNDLLEVLEKAVPNMENSEKERKNSFMKERISSLNSLIEKKKNDDKSSDV